MLKFFQSIKSYVLAAIDLPPPVIVPQGISTVIGWAIYATGTRGFKIPGTTLVWVMLPCGVVTFIVVDAIAKRFTPRTRWVSGILGWIGGLIAVWLYQLPLTR
jgi:hypothetical protein